MQKSLSVNCLYGMFTDSFWEITENEQKAKWTI